MNEQEQLLRFQNVIDQLIDPEKGCPWDKEQTPVSMCEYLIEECHELVDAIRSGKPGHACDEMGDLLFVLLLMARRFELSGQFSLGDALKMGADKMVRRHPHVFGDGHEDSPESVLVSWEQLKRREKGQNTVADSMDSVARSLPSLWRAEKLQKKAAAAGFEWPDVQGALDKLEEEVAELRRAVENGGDVPDELGDVLFAAVKVGRFCGCDPEDAVNGTCEKFIHRFRAVEEGAAVRGREVSQLSLEEMTALWNEAKRS